MPKTKLEAEVERQMAVIRRGAAEIITEEDIKSRLRKALAEGRPLRIKYGADPTAPDIHLGHSVVIRKMRQFQDLGHEVWFIIGDFTGRIGDPSGRSDTRRQMTEDEVRKNAKTYETQIYKLLDPARTKLVFNSQWSERLNFADVIRLASKYTVARMLERDDFAKRLREGLPVSVHELLYPLAQAHDSVAMRADVELGGTDQTFNFVLTRDIMREYGQEPQAVLTMPLLEGLDGVHKMSKSLGNYIGIAEPPGEMYGKTMSIPDNLIAKYFELVTDVPLEEVRAMTEAMVEGQMNPRDAKMRLAREIVSFYQGPEAAAAAEEEFVRVFRQKEVPEEMPAIVVRPGDFPSGRLGFDDLARLVREAGLVASAGEFRRLVEGGGVKVGEERVAGREFALGLRGVPLEGLVVRVGKRRFARLTVAR
ncbi:MAG TPA: tyrosine--tRNA ligase [Bacillota bacterium]|jgi:tyrosyl-tRNA synthetase